MIKGKHIVIGVTGGIAAYKIASLVSRLTKNGAICHIVMTKNATEFITPLTFETLSKNRVITDTFNREAPFEVDHVALSKVADVVLVAPATANIMAKAANGIADDFLSTFLLASRTDIIFAPAMNTEMLNNPATKRNIETLKADGRLFISSNAGMLACGDIGDGRMAEPDEMYDYLCDYFTEKDYEGLNVVVTAGPTRERIDDVRFLSNRSSGKMGYAIAEEAKKRGAKVTLISGPVSLKKPAGVNVISIESAKDMYDACLEYYADADVVIKAAAVADYTPKKYTSGKIKKAGDMTLELGRTNDILKELGERKNKQILVGFAAEAADLEVNAKGKLERKNLDIIVANDISRNDIGFASDENCVTLFFKDGHIEKFDKTLKSQIANLILNEIIKII